MSDTSVAVAETLSTQKQHRQNIIVKFNLLFIFAALFVVASLVAPQFLTSQNLANLLQQSSLTGIVAIGMTLVILTAGIDLSVGSVAALAGMLVAIFIGMGIAWPVALLLAVLAGAVSGGIVGSLSAYLMLPAFMVTLAALQSVRGLTYLTTNGTPTTSEIPMGLRFLGAGSVGPIPTVGIIFIVVAIVAGIVLNKTTYGEYIYAVGSNKDAARLSGLPVKKILVSVYVISGSLAAFAGILLTARLTIGQPTANQGLELDAIAAVVLGGTSLFGGKGSIFGTFVAVLLLSVLRNLFNLMGLSSFFQMLVTGLILVAALILNHVLDRRGSR
ncbi:ABC transporter permease [Rhodococcus fascians]|jgi:ribose transport system permease protein|uniref:ABC transporter permease n=1 Tax=Nocardiaceae TaxID=85025 RepID=UPI00050CA2F2|nr:MULTISPECIES: ABC transporter permease [Rhodococcus]KQU29928.1 ribonucleotide-diphosphate reductase subunit alpha [Rhodococcus sp. Leaf233]MBY4036511.1 ABC transporter permease [Rhodococcus fascians]MBY4139799.1 ABC transporter permease [Rhodococcus fascians]MBY4212230.1 ABC transporter permease [Rhodococcus fascians]MBY4216607.1 ABC transporter permease [Rhodococcus fascians]